MYAALRDSFGSCLKAPGVFRFELYEYVQYSSEPKGKRIIIWPDIDLTDAAENNEYWNDFLRAYEFSLDLEQDMNQRGLVARMQVLLPLLYPPRRHR